MQTVQAVLLKDFFKREIKYSSTADLRLATADGVDLVKLRPDPSATN